MCQVLSELVLKKFLCCTVLFTSFQVSDATDDVCGAPCSMLQIVWNVYYICHGLQHASRLPAIAVSLHCFKCKAWSRLCQTENSSIPARRVAHVYMKCQIRNQGMPLYAFDLFSWAKYRNPEHPSLVFPVIFHVPIATSNRNVAISGCLANRSPGIVRASIWIGALFYGYVAEGAASVKGVCRKATGRIFPQDVTPTGEVVRTRTKDATAADPTHKSRDVAIKEFF